MSEDLTSKCTKFYDDEIWSCKSRAYVIEALERFAKQQRAELWEQAAGLCLSERTDVESDNDKKEVSWFNMRSRLAALFREQQARGLE